MNMNKTKYKLIAADMDGTLLNDESLLTDRVKSAIVGAVGAGVLFVTATGRPMRASQSVNALFFEDMPFIIFNGVAAVKGKSYETLFFDSLDTQYADLIYQTGVKRNIPVIMWTIDNDEEKLWVSRDCQETRDYRAISGAELNIMEDPGKCAGSGVAKMMWIDGPDKIKIYRDEMAAVFKGKVNCYASRPMFLEFVGIKSSKGAALQKIGEIYKIDKSEMIAIGDSDNDISMLEYAGLGVAMENASDEVKAVCKYTVPSNNNEDGAAKVIEEFILNENLTGENKK